MCRVLFVFIAVLLVSCGGNLELTLPNSLAGACRKLKLSELADLQLFSCAYPGLLIGLGSGRLSG